jgi:hypothetical protein
MVKRSVVRLMIALAAFVLMPLVIVVPGFQHVCLHCSAPQQSDSCCSANPEPESSCCCHGESGKECPACTTQIKGFSFIGHTVMPSLVAYTSLGALDCLFFNVSQFLFSPSEIERDALEVFSPPLLRYNRSMQRLFCVLIC